MRIFVDNYLPSYWRQDIKKKIKNNEIRTWEFITDGDHERLLHTGDEQYADVVIKLVSPTKEEQFKGVKFTYFVPIIRSSIQDKDDIAIAEKHLGIVLGRFAELLNCHYADTIKEYRTKF